MAEIGDELVRDVAHRMRDACEPHQRAGVILTHKPRTAGGIGGGNSREPPLDPRSAQPCSPRSSWRSLLQQPAPFNGRSTIAVPAKPSALVYRGRAGGNSRRGILLPSACLFLQKGATDRAPAGSTLAGRGKPNRSRRVFVS